MTPETVDALALSVRVAVLATLLNGLVGIPLAYALARRRFRGKALVDLAVTLPLVLPPTVTGYYLIVLLGRRGWLGAPIYAATGWTIAFTWYAAVVAATVMALPLLVRTARAAIESVDRDLEKAAYTLGRSEWRTTLEVTLPLARNGILVCAILTFMTSFGEYIYSKSIIQDISLQPASVGLSGFVGPNSRDWSGIMAYAAIYVTPILAIFVLLQRRIVAGLTSGALK